MQLKFSKQNTKLHKAKVHVNSSFYWRLIFIGSAIVALAGAIFGFYLFSQINEEFNLFDSNAGQTSESIKEERLNKMLEHFKLREASSKDILSNPASSDVESNQPFSYAFSNSS